MRRITSFFALVGLTLAACSTPAPPADTASNDAVSDVQTVSDVTDVQTPLADAADVAPAMDAAVEASVDVVSDASAPVDAATACVVGGRMIPLGTRYAADDHCNWCDCRADGTSVCTTRTCAPSLSTCDYHGTTHPYGERFLSLDRCNECVCAASGLACTRRVCDGGAAADEGAILLDGLTQSCGIPTLTGNSVLEYVRPGGYHTAFVYERSRVLYPESLPDTMVHVQISYTSGFVVCRIPMPGQEAIDMEVDVEWRTDDGAFSEGFHTYLRRTNSMFVDQADTVSAVRGPSELRGTYNPSCLDPTSLGFSATFLRDGSASGAITKSCETDIGLTVGAWMVGPRS